MKTPTADKIILNERAEKREFWERFGARMKAAAPRPAAKPALEQPTKKP